MRLAELEAGLFLERELVKTVLQDRPDRPVGDALDAPCPAARCLETLGGVAVPEPEDAEAGPVALLRVEPLLQDPGDDGRRLRAGLLGPLDQA